MAGQGHPATLHLGVSPLSAASTTDEITALTGQLAAAGAAARDAALQASTTQPCLRLALAILRAAPDLADAVRAGQLDLTAARRALHAHQHPAGNPLSITYLTAPEVSALLRISRSAVYRLLADDRLLAVKAGPRSMRIPEPSVCRYLTGQAIAAIGQLGINAKSPELSARRAEASQGSHIQTPVTHRER